MAADMEANIAIKLDLDLQIAAELGMEQQQDLPDREKIEQWIFYTLAKANVLGEKQLTVRIVDAPEIKALNETYRHKSGATNVLSFPFEAPPGVRLPLLGDIVVCAPVVQREAQQQNKPVQNHWAHMVVHGTLHLLGYDHISVQDAEKMESLEVEILSEFKIPNPYREIETQAQ